MTDDLQRINREVIEMLGGCWHMNDTRSCSVGEVRFPCYKCGSNGYNPDYIAHPWELLAEMRKQEDWYEFYQYLNQPRMLDWVEYILDTTSGALAKAALEFLTHTA
jgi:hypothetical protein